jgi:hypothetical protein
MDYLACTFSFEAGNVSRPDIVNNATVAEYKSWRTVYDFVTRDDSETVIVPQFRVRSFLNLCNTFIFKLLYIYIYNLLASQPVTM